MLDFRSYFESGDFMQPFDMAVSSPPVGKPKQGQPAQKIMECLWKGNY